MIKYITLSLLVFVFLFALVMPVLADLPPDDFRLPDPGSGSGQVPISGEALIARIGTIGNWVFAIFLAISIIYILMAAFGFVTGGPEGVGEARQKLIYAAIGIAIALLAAGFDDIIRAIVTNA